MQLIANNIPVMQVFECAALLMNSFRIAERSMQLRGLWSGWHWIVVDWQFLCRWSPSRWQNVQKASSSLAQFFSWFYLLQLLWNLEETTSGTSSFGRTPLMLYSINHMPIPTNASHKSPTALRTDKQIDLDISIWNKLILMLTLT